MLPSLSPNLASLLNTPQDIDQTLTQLMQELCAALQCDRCFLYLRNPDTGHGTITHCYGTDPAFPDLTGASWIEAPDVAIKDPLMAIAFRTPEAVFVDDIETAPADVVNLDYERDEFGHRALIHAPIYSEGKLLGILEPCVFAQPRAWTAGDRALIAAVQEKLSPLAAAYVTQINL